MEPERPIEKLLRAFAKKRREDAGSNFELHPATRRMLQGEVARTFGKRAPEKRSFFHSLLENPRRLAWAAAVVGIVALLAAIILPAFRDEKNGFSLAKNEELGAAPKTEPVNAPVPTAAPGGAAKELSGVSGQPQPGKKDSELFDVQKDRALKKEKTADTTDGLLALNEPKEAEKPLTLSDRSRDESRTHELAIAPSVERKSPELAADIQDQTLNRRATGASTVATTPPQSTTSPSALGGALAARSIAPTAAAPAPSTVAAATASPQPATPSPALQPPAEIADKLVMSKSLVTTEPPPPPAPAQNSSQLFYFSDAAANVTNSQKFKQVGLNLGAAKKTSGTRSPAVKVLTAFQFEQNGGDVRILDADGSVYNGRLQVTNEPLRMVSDAVTTSGAARSYRQSAQAQSQMPSVQNVVFRVSGTNKSLKEKVVFTGAFLGLTNADFFGNASNSLNRSLFGGQNASQNQDSATLNLLNTSIFGKAQIGNKREVEIQAVPVAR